MNQLRKPLHLIIDGVDGTGKSTICRMMSRHLNIPLVKMKNMKEYADKDITEEMSAQFNDNMSQLAEYDFILDRGFPSSLVYSDVFNRKYDLSYIENIEIALKPVVIILTCKPEIRDSRLKSNEYMSKLDRVDIGFKKLAEKRSYHLIDTSYLSPIEICNQIITLLEGGLVV